MDASVFAKMLSDPGMLDLKKMGYKYGQGDMQEFLTLLKRDFFRNYPCMTLTENRWYTWKVWRGFHCRLLVFC